MARSSGPSATPRLGVIMLDTRFPRLPGDIGNPASFDVPVIYRRVAGATVAAVVVAGPPPPPVIQGILTAARGLDRDGVSVIATSCGFLGAVHERLQAAVATPVASSSLMLLPELRRRHGPGRPIGILTFDAARLSPRHFGPWRDDAVIVEGVATDDVLYRTIAEDRPELDGETAREEVIAAARRLLARAPDIPALVMECTNFSPYRAAVAAAIDRPVYDINFAIGRMLDLDPAWV